MTRHPAADRETRRAVVVEQDRRVVARTGWIADAAVAAARSDRVLQVLTPERSQITYPLELLIGDGHAQWVVRQGPERFRDGCTGEPLRWDGERFAAAGPPGPAVDAAAESVEIQLTTLHRPSGVQLGVGAEAVFHALTGAPPTGWGVAEPASEPWSPRELTRHCHDRSPDPTSVVVVGGANTVGALEVSRVDGGVRERLRLAGPPSDAVGQAEIDRLAAAVAGKARSMLVATRRGRSDGLRWNKPIPPALPYGLLIGHEAVRARGADHARSAPAPVRLLGLEERQAAWCLLTGGPGAPYEVLTALLTHFNEEAP